MRPGPRIDEQRRQDMARAFLSGAGRYDRVRPGYPEAVSEWLVPGGARDAVDVGAGTGLFTRALVQRGLVVTAVDPSSDMLAVLSTHLPDVRAVIGAAEQTHLPEASADLVTLAQAWHWVDHGASLREAGRVLRPGGRLGLVWNQLDVSLPWVHRLSRIMHAGDVFSPDDRPSFGPLFGVPEELLVRWTQELTLQDVVDLARSRSYYQRASPDRRERVEKNLQWYLTEYLAFAEQATVRLPYYTHAWRAALLPTWISEHHRR
jgi:SAM-dependent methyltransferase